MAIGIRSNQYRNSSSHILKDNGHWFLGLVADPAEAEAEAEAEAKAEAEAGCQCGLAGLGGEILKYKNKCLSDHMFSHSGHYPCE